MTTLLPRKGEVLFVPIGGCNEVGRNLTLYGHDGSWIIVDCGIGFPPAALQGGIDAVLPNPDFLYRNADRIRGLIITHAHEDHLGAIPYLWGERLTCPIFATRFAATLLEKKWHRMGEFFSALDPSRASLKINIFSGGESFDVSPFRITALPVAHSVPEACALCIETSCGIILHSGDWKLDSAPVIGAPVGDEIFDRAQSLAKERKLPLLAMMSDSTNMFENGSAGNEGSTQPALEQVFRKPYRRVIVTLFASNIARILSIWRAAKASGRTFSIAGTALLRMTEIARSCGYLKDLIGLRLDERLPAEKSVLLATGSQGETGSFMHRLAHREGFLDRRDAVVFSSRTIPGNEIAVGHIKNALAKRGVTLIDDRQSSPLHVSGHATGEEAERVYRRLSPPWLVPIHGEPRHLQENARRAEKAGLKTCIRSNGQGLRFAPSAGKGVLCESLTTPLPAEGQYLERGSDKPVWFGQSDKSVKERTLVSQDGACACFLTLSDGGTLTASNIQDARFIAFGDRQLEDLLQKRGRDLLEAALALSEERSDFKGTGRKGRGRKGTGGKGTGGKGWHSRPDSAPESAPESAPDSARDGDAPSLETCLARAFAKQLARTTGRRPLVKLLVLRGRV